MELTNRHIVIMYFQRCFIEVNRNGLGIKITRKQQI